METFIERSRGHSAGVISFYWGKTPDELKKSDKFVDALLRVWLERFEALPAGQSGPRAWTDGRALSRAVQRPAM